MVELLRPGDVVMSLNFLHITRSGCLEPPEMLLAGYHKLEEAGPGLRTDTKSVKSRFLPVSKVNRRPLLRSKETDHEKRSDIS